MPEPYNVILRAKRKSMGLTIEKMAEKLDVSVNSLAMWELGKIYPDAKRRRIIRDVLGINIPERSDP